MKILSLDPGNKRLGYAVVADVNNSLTLLEFGVIAYKNDPLLTFNENLNSSIENMVDAFSILLASYLPDEIASEIVPVARLGSNSEKVVAAITVCKTMATLHKIPWSEYGANTIKYEVTGDGFASKAQVARSIKDLFPDTNRRDEEERQRQRDSGEKRPAGFPADAWDAAAVGVTHIRKTRP